MGAKYCAASSLAYVGCQEVLFSSFYSTIRSTVMTVDICVTLPDYIGLQRSRFFFAVLNLDIGGVHTENCVVLLALTFFLIAWSADRNPVKGSRTRPGRF